jgi:hypothetical protein
VATPVTVPLPALLEEDPPLQPARSKANAVKPMPILDTVENLCLVFMVGSLYVIVFNRKASAHKKRLAPGLGSQGINERHDARYLTVASSY